MSNFTITNNTNDSISIFFPCLNESFIINSNEQKEIHLKLTEKSVFVVRQYNPDETFFKKAIGTIIAFFVSIPLWLTDCTENVSVNETIKCSTVFTFNDVSLKADNDIKITDSSQSLTAFDAVCNEIRLKGEPVFCNNEAGDIIKSYNKSLNISWAFPIIIIFAFLLYSLTTQKLIGSLILMCVLLIALFILFQKKRKIKKEILEISKTIKKFKI